MATEHKISATGREAAGKGASRRLRRAASIPAIVYGGNAAPQSIQLEHEKTWLASQNEWFYSSILDLDLDGKVQKVLLRDIQRHPYKQIIMHLDFQRVDENQALRAKVPLHFLNQEKSPAGKTAGVVVTHELNEVEVSCLPKDLPEFIEVDLSNLAVGDIIHLSELALPAGIEIAALKLGKEHDVAIVVAKHGRVEAEETAEVVEAPVEAPVAAAAAKPAKKDEK
jgi:large subunit ribosomal protein L25